MGSAKKEESFLPASTSRISSEERPHSAADPAKRLTEWHGCVKVRPDYSFHHKTARRFLLNMPFFMQRQGHQVTRERVCHVDSEKHPDPS